MSEPDTDVGVTPVPNELIEKMGILRDTEFRLLIVILRQTWGWHKEQDWLTHRQLAALTGRASRALSRAISALVAAGIVVVRNRAGLILDSAVARRRERTGLYFSLHPDVTATAIKSGSLRLKSLMIQKANNKTISKKKYKAVVVVGRKDSPASQNTGVDGRRDARDGQSSHRHRDRQEDLTSRGGVQTDSSERDQLSDEGPNPFLRNPVVRESWHRLGDLLRRRDHQPLRGLRWK